MLATTWFGQYDIACLLLESGADHMAHDWSGGQRLAHFVENEQHKRQGKWSPGEAARHAKLVRLLEERGESFDEIRKEREWDRLSWHGSPAAKTKFQQDHHAEVTRLKQAGSNFNRKPGLSSGVLLYQFIGERGLVRLEYIQVMIDEGVDLNQPLRFGETPAMSAVRQNNQFELALRFLRSGADPGVPLVDPRTGKITRLKLIHYVARAAEGESQFRSQQRLEFQQLVDWLTTHGESIEQAKAERHLWEPAVGAE